MSIFVVLGNPLLPFRILADFGFAWHHVFEILALFFLGAWFSFWSSLNTKKLNRNDPVFIVVLVALAYIIGMILQPPEVATLVAVLPSIFGFILRRTIMDMRES